MIRCVFAASGAAALLLAPSAHAQRTELGKLRASDGAADDWFGRAVAIDGSTAIVGAYPAGVNGRETGAAYLFDVTDPRRPVQLAKLSPSDGIPLHRFGSAVAIAGGVAVVGAWGDADNGRDSGAAYVFDVTDPAHPAELAKLLASDGSFLDSFGSAVAIDGHTAVVGAYGDDPRGDSSGSAYLFDLSDPASPVEIAKLVPDPGAPRDFFGFSVAVAGGRVAVGALFADGEATGSGAVFLFDARSGAQLAQLLASDAAANDWLGFSVAMGSGTVIAGAPGRDDCPYCGAVYLFDAVTGAELAKVSGSEADGDEFFGQQAAAAGSTAMVGTLNHSGRAYVLDLGDPGAPARIATLVASDGASGDGFGGGLAVSGGIAIVSAWLDDDNGENSGSAYLFDATRCPPDLTGDGVLDTRDIIEFLNRWAAGDPAADWDGDGDVDGEDVTAFLWAWLAGCF